MKRLFIAVMLLISTVGISQVTVTKYDTTNVAFSEEKWDVETSYTFKESELVLKVRALDTDKVSTVYYRILEVTQSTDSNAWTCYKCMDSKGFYVNHTFFYNGIKMMAIHYESGKYAIIEGGGLVY